MVATTPATTSAIQPLEAARSAHAAELLRSAGNWSCAEAPAPRAFSDGDFASWSVRAGFAGPDEALLRGGHRIHATRDAVADAAECAAVVEEASAAMAAGRKSTFTYTKASRLGEVHVADLPNTKAWLQAKLRDTLYPLLASRFGGAAGDVVAADELAVYDSLVIKYDASRGGTRQPLHRDGALISVNIALNDGAAYTGGGTFFEALEDGGGGGGGGSDDGVLSLKRGHALVHASGARHAGHPITSGERWVLVVFILAKRAEQLARRCGELAVEERRAGRVDEAHAAFEAGLAACGGTDHELHHGLAGVLAMKGEFAASRGHLATAAALYPPCPKPPNAMGALLLEGGRTRAALRWYERSLARATDVDGDDAWDSAVNAANCVVLLAEREAAAAAAADGGGGRWRAALPEARRRLWRALAGTPGEGALLGLLQRSAAVRPPTADERAEEAQLMREAADAQRARLGEPIKRSGDGDGDGGTLLIAFAGADAALGGGIRGGVPGHEFVAACRRAGVRRALFVRDVMRAWYLRGLGGGDGDDGHTFEGAMALLRREIAAVRPRRVVTIGSSMGAYGAARAALALGAERAIAFSPQVLLEPAARAAAGLPDDAPFDPLLRGLSAAGAAADFPLVSLVDAVSAADAPAHTRLEVHVGSGAPADVVEAELLRAAAGDERCTITLHEGRDHNLVTDMRDAGELDALLRRIAAGDDEGGGARDPGGVPRV